MTRPHHMGRVCRASGARGYSLLEIIVVLSLMAIISAAVVPVFSSSLTGLKQNDALRNLVSLIQFVQEKAVSESQVYRVCFDTEANTYWVMQPAVDPDEEGDPFERVEEPYGRRKKLPRGMAFRNLRARVDRENDYEYFECYPNGASDKLVIDFEFPGDRSRTAKITVKGMLGRVELEE